jgi:hypothetical protein
MHREIGEMLHRCGEAGETAWDADEENVEHPRHLKYIT